MAEHWQKRIGKSPYQPSHVSQCAVNPRRSKLSIKDLPLKTRYTIAHDVLELPCSCLNRHESRIYSL